MACKFKGNVADARPRRRQAPATHLLLKLRLVIAPFLGGFNVRRRLCVWISSGRESTSTRTVEESTRTGRLRSYLVVGVGEHANDTQQNRRDSVDGEPALTAILIAIFVVPCAAVVRWSGHGMLEKGEGNKSEGGGGPRILPGGCKMLMQTRPSS